MTSSSNRRRPWDERRKAGPLALTDRDREIIRAVHRFRFLTSGQLAELFFTSRTKANRRLRALYDHGYLDRIVRPAAEGREELIYALWKQGAALLAEAHADADSIGWKPARNRVRPGGLQHELNLINFHVLLDQAVARTHGVSWLRWCRGDELTMPPTWNLGLSGTRRGSRVKLIPDAFFALQTAKGRTAFFVEIDRGTEAGSSILLAKLRAYERAFESGAAERVIGFRKFRVLTVAPSEKRVEQALGLMIQLNHPLLHWFAVLGALSAENTLVQPVWRHGQSPAQLSTLLG